MYLNFIFISLIACSICFAGNFDPDQCAYLFKAFAARYHTALDQDARYSGLPEAEKEQIAERNAHRALIMRQQEELDKDTDFLMKMPAESARTISRQLVAWRMVVDPRQDGYRMARYFGIQRQYKSEDEIGQLIEVLNKQFAFGELQRFFLLAYAKTVRNPRTADGDPFEEAEVIWSDLPQIYRSEAAGVEARFLLAQLFSGPSSSQILRSPKAETILDNARALADNDRLGENIRNILRFDLDFLDTYQLVPNGTFEAFVEAINKLPELE